MMTVLENHELIAKISSHGAEAHSLYDKTTKTEYNIFGKAIRHIGHGMHRFVFQLQVGYIMMSIFLKIKNMH